MLYSSIFWPHSRLNGQFAEKPIFSKPHKQPKNMYKHGSQNRVPQLAKTRILQTNDRLSQRNDELQTHLRIWLVPGKFIIVDVNVLARFTWADTSRV
jgi:hypothetical protein